jgi:tRNA dimethylallyltransferase
MQPPLLLVIAGPTASGKTALAIRLALRYGLEILSADSRQFYRDLHIGTAKPSPEELQQVRHHFIDSLALDETYDISRYEQDALTLLGTIFRRRPAAILCGGSGLYIRAVCNGLDPLPGRDAALRARLAEQLRVSGLEALRRQLADLDPEYYSQADLNNPHRIVRAIEVCLLTGQRYSALRKGEGAARPFRTFSLAPDWPRDVLYARIDERVDRMMAAGLEEEARRVHPLKHLQALQSVGYTELFDYFEGRTGRPEAIRRIKQHTRNLAKRQMTWFRREAGLHWFRPEEEATLAHTLDALLTPVS